MTFDDILEQVITLLKRQGRVSYRALKMRFEEIDDKYLDVLKEEILFAYPVSDEDGRGLVWNGETGSPEQDARHGAAAEIRFHALLPAVLGLLKSEGRVTYRTLKHIFGLDDAVLDEIRKELSFRQVARDELGEGLVWTGETQPMTPSVANVSRLVTTEEATVLTSPAVPIQSPVTEPSIPSNGPTAPPEAISTDVLQDESIIPSDPIRTAPDAERRQLTVMFCDLADSTKLSQELDPEDLREVIRAYQQTSAEVIQHFDGYIAQHLGDGLLIYFGWPKAHEDDAQRALHAGLGIVEAITTTLNPRLEAEKEVQLTVRLGVHTGPVVVGQMGGDGRQESLATGETVNIAARLEGLAQANTVIISNVTERLVRGAFEFEDLGPHELKGVSEPIAVFRVLGPTEIHRDEDESLPDGGVFLVGRDEEVGLLLRRWEQGKEGLGQVVLISGEAGIGKSSLVATVRAHVMDEGRTRITFRCSPYHTNSALYPVITHLEQMLGFDRDDSPDTKLDKLEQVLRTTNLPLEESIPLLATLLSAPLEDRYPAPTQSPQQQRQQTLDTLVTWLIEESEKQPVLAVWEDLHWADPSTLEMLGLVLEQSPTVPMFNVLTFRPEFSPPWSTRSHMTPITLNRLERPQVEALITHMADDKPLPAEVVEHIVAKTDGVPLYVEELSKMLLTSDLLREEAGQYVLTGPLSTVTIPDTLQDSLMARLDQMNTAKEVAQLGAVIGREFAYDMLQAVSSQDEETLQEGLAQLVSAELLYQRGRPPRARYIFKHMLLQNVAYASLLRSTRQQVHQQIAQVLVDQFPETAETQPEWLAYHYTEAGLSEQAVDYWQLAGQKAIQRSANVEAISHFKQGLELLKGLPDTRERHQHELDMQTALGTAFMAAKGQGAPEVEQAYARARALCQHVGETPRLFPVLWGLWRFYFIRAEQQTARELGEQCLRLAQQLHDDTCLLGAHFALGGSLFYCGEPVLAHAHLEQGIALYDHRAYDDLTLRYGIDPGVWHRCYDAHAAWILGYPALAAQRIQEAFRLSQALAHPQSLAAALAYAAVFHQFRREDQLVSERAEAVITLARERGLPQFEAIGTICAGWALAVQGQGEKGLARLHQGLTAHQSTGVEVARPWSFALLVEAYGTVKQPEQGLSVLAELLETVDALGGYFYEAELHRLKGELLLQLSPDNTLEAESYYQKALDVARSQQAKSLELRAATSLAKLWQSQDKRKEARTLLGDVYGWFTEGFDTADLKDAKALLDELSESR